MDLYIIDIMHASRGPLIGDYTMKIYVYVSHLILVTEQKM